MKNKQVVLDSITFGLERDNSYIPASYISFNKRPAIAGKVTNIWSVLEGVTHVAAELGEVRWFPRWRKYGFFTREGMVLEETCMREIAFFCETATKFHKQKRKLPQY